MQIKAKTPLLKAFLILFKTIDEDKLSQARKNWKVNFFLS